MEYSFSRRDVLRYGATAGGVGVVGALSGCSAIGGLLGDGADPSYPEWLAAPGEITDDEHYAFFYEDIEGIRDAESAFNASVVDDFTNWGVFDQYGLAPDDVEEVVRLAPVGSPSQQYGFTPGVISGSFATEDVADTLETADWQETDSSGEYTLYRSPEEEQFAAVTEGIVIHDAFVPGIASNDPTADLEALIDTKNGEADRYVDVNEDMNVLVDELGTGTFVFGSTNDPIEETDVTFGRFEGLVAEGYTDTVDGDSTDTELVYVFDTADDVDMGAIEDWYAGNDTSAAFDDSGDLSSSRDGRIVTITGTVATADLYT